MDNYGEIILKAHFLLIALLCSSSSLAMENISFEVEDPYPVCIQEIQELEPDLPLSYFKTLGNEKSDSVDRATPCADALNEETLSQGLDGLKSFYFDNFPKIEQEIFAQEFVKKGNYQERLKLLNDTLINCQERTEKLHKLAARAAGDIYEQSNELDKVPEGYELVDKKNDFFIFPDSDVKAYILRPKEPNKNNLPAIISFAGTRSLKSAAADVNYGASQVNNVKVKFFQWINTLKDEKVKEVIITGHSLGGGLAQTLSAMIPHPFDIKTHVVTFNGFGGKDAIKAYGKVYGRVDKNRDYDKFQPTRDAVGYRMEGDIVSLMGQRFGEARTIPTKYNSLRFVTNHLMTTIDERIASSPHILREAKKENTSTMIRPISFIVQGASTVNGVWNTVKSSVETLFEKECKISYDPLMNKNNLCKAPDGDAELCHRLGSELKADTKDLSRAMEKFKTGCELCHKDSCVEYAVLNKVVGYENRTLLIAKKACDLGDSASCIEAGTLVAQNFKATDRTNDKYVFMACAYGETRLCGFTKNQFFASKYNKLKTTTCKWVGSIDHCELLYLNTVDDSIPKDLVPIIRTERLDELVGKKNIDLEQQDSHGETPLLMAINYRNLDMVKELVKRGASLESSSVKLDTPLHKAIRSGDAEIVKYLLENGVKFEERDFRGATPLILASKKSSPEMIKLLISKGASPNVADKNGATPLMSASENGNYEIAKLLITSETDLEVKDSSGNTALTKAILSGNLDLVKLLIDNGARIDPSSDIGKSPMYFAALNGNLEMLEYLRSKGSSINLKSSFGTELLSTSLVAGNLKLVNFLIANGAAFDASNDKHNKILNNAVMGNDLNIVKFVMKQNPNINGQDELGSTPLHYSAYKREVDIAKYLLENGANIEIKNLNGNTPLWSAASGDNLPMTKLLVEKGANLESKNNTGATPVLKAASQGSLPIVDYLLSKGAKPDAADNNGKTLLQCAVESNNLELVKYLVAKGVQVDSKDLKNASSEITIYLNTKMSNLYDVTNPKQQIKVKPSSK